MFPGNILKLITIGTTKYFETDKVAGNTSSSLQVIFQSNLLICMGLNAIGEAGSVNFIALATTYKTIG